MTADTLLRLADRCERDPATVMLNIDIARAIGWYSVQFGSVVWRDTHHNDHVTVPNYTESLDAAVTLVPTNYQWSASGAGTSCLYQIAPDKGEIATRLHAGMGSTAALALCAAALRARAALLTLPTSI